MIDTEIKYLWTKDMLSFYQSGESSEDGTTVVLSEYISVNGIKEIVAEIISGSAESIFVKYIVDHAAILSWGSGRNIGCLLYTSPSPRD